MKRLLSRGSKLMTIPVLSLSIDKDYEKTIALYKQKAASSKMLDANFQSSNSNIVKLPPITDLTRSVDIPKDVTHRSYIVEINGKEYYYVPPKFFEKEDQDKFCTFWAITGTTILIAAFAAIYITTIYDK